MKHLARERFDVIVIGAGHAGCEAALAASRLGAKVLVLAINVDKIAHMPCNPAIGGIGKGQLVREVDALGGQMGRTIDKAMVQLKMLNSSKGPAVRAPRAQADKKLYSTLMKNELLREERLTLRQEEALGLYRAGERELVVSTATGSEYVGTAVIVTTGTFLSGQTIIGQLSIPGGRVGEAPSTELSSALRNLGLGLGRFQSATPPRILERSCDFSRMSPQPGDAGIAGFSFMSSGSLGRRQRLCWLTHTNKETHKIIERNMHLSPIKSGSVSAKGPRYCPSIDRKVLNFPDRDEHSVFVEPEGWKNREMYLQGLTTSMPVGVQEKIIQSVAGLGTAKMIRPGYAVAYDYLVSGQLGAGLETKAVRGLFTAGQINGTSGYEEAAAQGLIAGINAARFCTGKEQFVLRRSQAYIGVLIDDLVTKDIDEPYRMFTSRAEHRLILRSDNADLRLTHIGHELGLVGEDRMEAVLRRKAYIGKCLGKLGTIRLSAEKLRGAGVVLNTGTGSVLAKDLLKRPEIRFEQLKGLLGAGNIPRNARQEAEVEVKYEGYIQREMDQIAAQERLENMLLPEINYSALEGLSGEAKAKLDKVRPHSLGQAGRIAGVSPADIAVLMVHLRAYAHSKVGRR